MRRWAVVPVAAFLALAAACQNSAGDEAGGIATPPVVTAVSTPSPSATSGDKTVFRHGHAFPDQALTPGETLDGVTAAQVCTSGWASAHRHVTEAIRHQVFAAYGIDYSTHSKYELDHLISLELGGTNSTRNLWPEPLTDDDTIGPSKDALENHLHDLVCADQLDLGAAQRGIASNWLQMWNDYEHLAVHKKSSPGGSSGGGTSGGGGSSGSSGSGSSGSSGSGDATAICRDGSLSHSQHRQGTCSHHGGVRQWL